VIGLEILSLRRLRRPCAFGLGPAGALLLLVAVAGCSRLPAVAMPGSGNKGTADLFENRVWLDTGADAPAGTLRAFLSDGTLIMSSCAETYRLAPWRWVDGATVVWDEDGANIRADVALVGRDELVLLLDLADGSVSQHFAAAQSPVVCPDARG
jgi:hypothetical protein